MIKAQFLNGQGLARLAKVNAAAAFAPVKVPRRQLSRQPTLAAAFNAREPFETRPASDIHLLFTY